MTYAASVADVITVNVAVGHCLAATPLTADDEMAVRRVASGELALAEEMARAARDVHGYAYERRTTALRMTEIERDPWVYAGPFDLAHLERVHRQVFLDCAQRADLLSTADVSSLDMLRSVLDHMAHERPALPSCDAVCDLAAEHWANLAYASGAVGGDRRVERAFVQLYLRQAGWDLDWSRVDLGDVSAARRVAICDDQDRYCDYRWLSAALRPGMVRFGQAVASTPLALDDMCERAIEGFRRMSAAKRRGIDPRAYFVGSDQTEL
ncbi:hypothetical protein [Gordonia sp. (in: high G+C Gram-positive bacteria)]|uniref:hypothetical protein n=1 Tax=Gordonia sp. (in: high G+C Gram-positive bacteria) TaxID=84139 RepID=UPI00333F9D02